MNRTVTRSPAVRRQRRVAGLIEPSQDLPRRTRGPILCGGLAAAAHQLRTPIAGLRLASEALLRQRGQGDRERLLTNVVAESARAGRVLAGMLKMTRLVEGEPLVRERCDLLEIVESEIERFQG